MKNLRDFLERKVQEKVYFQSDVPFYNGGTDFMLYRVATLEDLQKNEMIQDSDFYDRGYFFVVPARYDSSLEKFIDLVPVAVFRNQHLNDPVFSTSIGKNYRETCFAESI